MSCGQAKIEKNLVMILRYSRMEKYTVIVMQKPQAEV